MSGTSWTFQDPQKLRPWEWEEVLLNVALRHEACEETRVEWRKRKKKSRVSMGGNKNELVDGVGGRWYIQEVVWLTQKE